ncbi:MAG: hypothetical protein ACP5KV_04655 [Candidatus Methanomethylicaceae archaeon]
MVPCRGEEGGFFTVEVGEEISLPLDLLRKGRAFIMCDVTFSDFKKGLEEMFGPRAAAVLYHVGLSCGRRSCSRLSATYGRDRILEALAMLPSNLQQALYPA